MSKRLIRVKPEAIKQHQFSLQQRPFNAILSNGNTVFGRLISLDDVRIAVKDTRDHLHQIAISDLYELVYDESKGSVPPSRHATI